MIDNELKRQFPRLSNLTVQSLTDIWDTQT